jgi:hypothetical protein
LYLERVLPEEFLKDFSAAARAALEADLEHEVLKEIIRSIPGLFWVKRKETSGYRMIAVSRDYAELYLGSRHTRLYEGKMDSDIWGPRIAALFNANDDRAMEQGCVKVSEKIESPLTGTAGAFVGTKWPVELDGVTFVCGLGEHHDG